MRTALRRVALATIPTLVALASWAGPPIITVPIPRDFSPQPSATILFCRPVAGMDIMGRADTDESGKPLPRPVVEIRAGDHSKVSDTTQLVRIRFEPTVLQVSLGYMTKTGPTYGPDFPYDILNDAPSDFFALWRGGAKNGQVQVIALNRLTGTAVISSTSASFSISGRDHPHSSSTFMTCASRQSF
jgi:hypothetical protein